MAAARGTLESGDLDAMKQANERLSQAAMKIGEAMYRASQAPGGEGGDHPAGGAHAADDGVVDAEFEDLDDKKKRAS